MNSTIYTIALAASIITILLGLFTLIMAIIRHGKQKDAGDPQAHKLANKRLVSGIFSAIFISLIGFGLLMVVLYYITG
jgi:hypothetical protein